MEHEIKQEGLQLELQDPALHPAPALMPPQQMQVARAPTAMDLIADATRRGASVQEIGQLIDLKDRLEAAEAKKAFVSAMAAFKRNPPTILKSKMADFRTEKGRTVYSYADLSAVCEGITASLAEHGMMHDWTTTQQGPAVTVTCTITHELGHSKATTLTANADKTGSKNDIQAIGSAVSYLERYTLLAACGIAVSDGSDDDGAAAGLDPNAVRDAVAERRAKDTPTTVRGRREGQDKPAGDPPPELVKLAKESAAVGITQYGKFWKHLTQGERNQLLPMHDELQEVAKSIGQG